jgi:hypothetical protein
MHISISLQITVVFFLTQNTDEIRRKYFGPVKYCSGLQNYYIGMPNGPVHHKVFREDSK